MPLKLEHGIRGYQPSNPLRRLGVCIPFVILVIGVFFLPSPRSQALRNTQQSETKPKRKISLGSAPPEEVKIIGIRHTDDDEWYEKFEFEIKNDSKKDIWYMDFRVILPEFAKADGDLAFRMKFGDTSPNSGGINNPNKPLLRPGEGYLFRIPQYQVENFRKRYSPDGISVPTVRHLRLELYKVFFTDGTGFLGGRPVIMKQDGRLIPVTQNKVALRSATSVLTRTMQTFPPQLCSSV
jgi:hypothetical protein